MFHRKIHGESPDLGRKDAADVCVCAAVWNRINVHRTEIFPGGAMSNCWRLWVEYLAATCIDTIYYVHTIRIYII